MSDKKLPVITISRQYGAGGRSIARGLSERLGLEFYDADFVRLTAKVSGYSTEDVEREGEDISNRMKFLNQFFNAANFVNSYDEIYRAQREVVLELAKKPCIIVGRCSNYILREAKIPSFDIYLYADEEHRIARARELGQNGDMPLEKYVERREHLRRTYYRTYTGHEIDVCDNYNICLDTGTIGFDNCVDIIEKIVRDI